jgi:hypothetical protein
MHLVLAICDICKGEKRYDRFEEDNHCFILKVPSLHISESKGFASKYEKHIDVRLFVCDSCLKSLGFYKFSGKPDDIEFKEKVIEVLKSVLPGLKQRTESEEAFKAYYEHDDYEGIEIGVEPK